jgi:rhodanese-related sulfurtransferase
VPYFEVSPQEIMARLAAGNEVFLLDVREPDEVSAWAYPVGVNIPLGQLGDRLGELPRDITITVACHVGGRSAVAAAALSEAGWSAENLTGGAVAWAAAAESPDGEAPGARGG